MADATQHDNPIQLDKTTVVNTNTVHRAKLQGRRGGNAVLTTKVLINCNLGNTTLTTAVSMKDFFHMSVVANKDTAKGVPEEIAQRNLSKVHAKGLAIYLIKSMLTYAQKMRENEGIEPNEIFEEILDVVGRPTYSSIQPFVCNIRDCDKELVGVGYEEQLDSTGFPVGATIRLIGKERLHLVDGQHRRAAIKMLLDFLVSAAGLKKLPKTSLIAPYQISDPLTFSDAMAELLEIAENHPTAQLECHIGLNIAEERQLFSDLNNCSRKVDQTIITAFDSSNPVCSFVSSLIEENNLEVLTNIGITNAIMLTSKMLMNSYKPKPCTSLAIREKEHRVIEVWEAIDYNLSNNAVFTNMLNSLGVLKALTGIVYKVAFSRQPNEESYDKLIQLIRGYDFDLTTNLVFSIQTLSDEEIEEADLTKVRDGLRSKIYLTGDYTKEDIESRKILEMHKSHLVLVYINIFTTLLDD